MGFSFRGMLTSYGKVANPGHYKGKKQVTKPIQPANAFGFPVKKKVTKDVL